MAETPKHEQPTTGRSSPTALTTEEASLVQAAFAGDLGGVRKAIAEGADVNVVDPETGLSPLHIAVGTNDYSLCRYLIEECGAAIMPDRSGRWPTLIAAQCHVSMGLSGYIVEQEARAEDQKARTRHMTRV